MTQCLAFCNHEAKWERVTQFSGLHPYCYKHARMQEDWHKKDDDSSFWRKIKPEKKELKSVKKKKAVKLSDKEKNFLILAGDVGFYAHRYVRSKLFGDGERINALSQVISQAETLIDWAKDFAAEEAAS